MSSLLTHAGAGLAILFILAMPAVGTGAEGSPGVLTDEELRSQGYLPLFDGNSLEGWNVEPWHEGHWTAHDGVIFYDGKSTHRNFAKNSLWTKNDYGDLELYAEWRLPAPAKPRAQPIVLFNGDFLLDEKGNRITRMRPDAGDSGILFRGEFRCQANIWCQELGSGEINGFRTDRNMAPNVRRACIPLKKADLPLGEWNAFHISLAGNEMSVELNGEKVIDSAPLTGLRKRGPVGLQHHGDPVEFRRLWVKPID